MQQQETPREGELPRTGSEERQQVFVQPKLEQVGNPCMTSRGQGLLRKFLVAQEEMFAFKNEASLFPLDQQAASDKAGNEVFVRGVRGFLDARGIRGRSCPAEFPCTSLSRSGRCRSRSPTRCPSAPSSCPSTMSRPSSSSCPPSRCTSVEPAREVDTGR